MLPYAPLEARYCMLHICSLSSLNQILRGLSPRYLQCLDIYLDGRLWNSRSNSPDSDCAFHLDRSALSSRRMEDTVEIHTSTPDNDSQPKIGPGVVKMNVIVSEHLFGLSVQEQESKAKSSAAKLK
jgi:hypothetical protein